MRWSAQLLLTVAVTWLIVRQVGVSLEELRDVGRAVPAPSGWLLGGSVLVLLGGFLFSARLWGGLVGELGGRDPGWVPSARIVLTANLGRYIPGKLWQVAGLAVLSRREGIPATVGGAAAVLAQSFGLLAAGIVGIPVLVALFGPEGGVSPLLLALGAVVLLTFVASLPPLLDRLLALAFRWAKIRDTAPPRTGGTFGFRWIALHLVLWAIYGGAFLLFVLGLGLATGPLEVVPAFAAAYLLGYLAIFAPAGLGVREGFLIAFLRPELGVAAVGVSVLARVWMTVVELVPAGGFALWEIYRPAREGETDP